MPTSDGADAGIVTSSTALSTSAHSAHSAALRNTLLQLLDDQEREAELWLARHHKVVRQAVERALHKAAEQPPAQPVEERHSDQRNSAPEELSAVVSPPRGSHGGSLNSADVKFQQSSSSRRTGNSRDRSAFVKTLTGAEGFDRQEEQSSLRGKFIRQWKRVPIDIIMGILIVLNALFVFVEMEVQGRRGDRVLQGDDLSEMPEVSSAFMVIAQLFNAAFLSEVLVKLFIDSCKYFCSLSNIFDTLAVLATSIDLYILQSLRGKESFLSTMRMLRLWRLLRIIRMIDVFQPLRVLMHSVMLSFMSIFWSLLVLAIFMFEGSLLLCQLLQPFVVNTAEDLKPRTWANRYYGTSSKSLYTIFEATFSGCWPTYARDLVENVSPWYAAFFVPYVTFVIFTLIRIIYALLLKDTLQAAANDADVVIQNKMRETKNLVKKLSDLFMEADASGDGYLGRDEFEQILAYPRVQTWMNALGLDTQDTNMLFQILDDGENPDGMISQKEFVNGIMRLKGHEQKQDLLVGARDMGRILHHCKHMQVEVANLRDLIHKFFLQSTATARV